MAALLTVELLRFSPTSPRTEKMFEALGGAAERAGIALEATTSYRGDADVLLLWGPGAPNRWPAMDCHRSAGKPVVCLDLAYWSRDRKVRFSINAAHPQAWLFRKTYGRERFDADPAVVADHWNPDGPVVIAGVGPKAVVQYANAMADWEQSMIAACRRLGRPIVYRPKRPDCPSPAGVPRVEHGSIDDVLAGASLLVTWHSNAAIDAIRLGIPVVCRDGAAAAVCPSALPEFGDPQPLPSALRDQLLTQLAWFQWRADEAGQAWRWLRDLVAVPA